MKLYLITRPETAIDWGFFTSNVVQIFGSQIEPGSFQVFPVGQGNVLVVVEEDEMDNLTLESVMSRTEFMSNDVNYRPQHFKELVIQ